MCIIWCNSCVSEHMCEWSLKTTNKTLVYQKQYLLWPSPIGSFHWQELTWQAWAAGTAIAAKLCRMRLLLWAATTRLSAFTGAMDREGEDWSGNQYWLGISQDSKWVDSSISITADVLRFLPVLDVPAWAHLDYASQQSAYIQVTPLGIIAQESR